MFPTKLIEKFWASVDKGTSGALKPMQTRRTGKALIDAKRDEMLMIAQTENDVADIKSGKKKYTEDRKLITVESACGVPLIECKEDKVEPYINFELLEKQKVTRKYAQDIQEEIHLTKAILMAEHDLLNSEYESNEEPIDQDWFTRWRDSAEKVSNEDLQSLWAKALAGEVATPGSYSLRTLEFLKNLSQAEAREISKLAPFVINKKVFKLPDLENKGLEFDYLLEMEDLGILSGVEVGGLSWSLGTYAKESYVQNMQYGGKILLIEKDEPIDLQLSVYKVTKLGCEILKLGIFPFDYDYFEQVGLQVKKQQYKVRLANMLGTYNNQIHFDNEHEL
ncbi:DUF2806 domain-containing protein [Vibrio sp. 10N.286.52.C3]|uniref:DUF2806 domain-containing protein n=2 Tax=Vibrio TaxID=662 RepID=UPI00354F1252